MIISFFWTTTSESLIGNISKSIVWLRRPFLVFNLLYSKYAHQDKSQWTVHFSCVRLSISTPTQYDILVSPSGNAFACMHRHPSKRSLSMQIFRKTSVCSVYDCFCCCCCYTFIFSLTIFCPVDFQQWSTGFLLDGSSDCWPTGWIISCLCHGVMSNPLLQKSSHFSVAIWLCGYLSH